MNTNNKLKQTQESMLQFDHRLREHLILQLHNLTVVDESSELEVVCLARTHDSIVLSKTFKNGNTQTKTIFSHGDGVEQTRTKSFLTLEEISKRAIKSYDYINPNHFRCIPYEFATNWKAYAIRHGESVIIFLDLSGGPLIIRV